MDLLQRDLPTLFAQLGLPNRPGDIQAFIASHPLAADIPLAEAPFWTPAQAGFLREALASDGEWAELVDELAMLLSDAA
ncbi:DUF2789 domain-containing protein [Chitinilyticum litopenaei]|uniref:DUF2789 domain-containing protein n=1 Tax=Chitinilyticum litopenaei TaxID=1121276 RepID=UPI0004131221|nr:DUF2789 domain-containing protein [Chitinilyticum litopenaei]